jgi:voltage-gated potassium channel
MDHEPDAERKAALNREREGILQQLDSWLHGPMLVLGVVWTLLLIMELVQGLSPLLEGLGLAIWIIFALERALEFTGRRRKASISGGSG